LKKLINLLLIY